MRAPHFATLTSLLFTLGVHAQGLAAQPQPPPPANGVIVGQVVDGTSGRPVPGALVTLTPAPGGMGNVGPGDAIPMDQLMSLNVTSLLSGIRQAITDGQGRFAFTGLTRAMFSLAATKPGWSGGGYGQRRPDGTPSPFVLSGDGRVGDVQLPLWKNAAIGGTIVDEAGEPIVGVGVRVLRRMWLAGRPRYAMGGTASTDDRGMFRIGGLRPGEYVAVVPQTAATTPANTGASGMDPAMLQSMIAAAGPGADPNQLIATITSMATTAGSTNGIRVGDWVLQTSASGSRLIPPAGAGAGRMAAYRTTFYPNAASSGQASAFTLGSGEDHTGVDFQLKPVPVVQISGAVSGPEGALSGVQVRLLPAGSDELASDSGFESATTTTNATGAFAFLAVPPAQYSLRVVKTPRPAAGTTAATAAALAASSSTIQNAQGNRAVSMGPLTMDMMMPAPPPIPAEPTLWATSPITVGDADLTGVTIALRAGYRVSGRAEFDGAAARPTPEQLKRISILLDRADTGGASPLPIAGISGTPAGQFDDTGQFTTYGVVPGKYFIRVPFTFGGWTLRSATLAGRDLADDPLEIESADVSGVTLTFTDRATELSGVVRDAQSRPAGAASVVVFAVQSDHWIDFGSSPRRLRTTKTGADGRYRITGLPPGDYFIAASTTEAGTDWQNPAFLEMASRAAQRMTISDGERKAVDLVAR